MLFPWLQGVAALLSTDVTLASIQERHLALEGSITQRLKWAAGANHTLSGVLRTFEESVRDKGDRINVSSLFIFNLAKSHQISLSLRRRSGAIIYY